MCTQRYPCQPCFDLWRSGIAAVDKGDTKFYCCTLPNHLSITYTETTGAIPKKKKKQHVWCFLSVTYVSLQTNVALQCTVLNESCKDFQC